MIYDLHLVPQVWHGITWEHQLQVFLPKGVRPTATMFLWNQGGKSTPLSVAMGMDLAKKMKAPVAFLFHVPNQPLLDGKKEDALIAETFVRYLKTKDETWPLLFPMVKSVVRAMGRAAGFRQAGVEDRSQAFRRGGHIEAWLDRLAHGPGRCPCQGVGAARFRHSQHARPVAVPAQELRQVQRNDQGLHQFAGWCGNRITPEAKRLWRMVDPWCCRAGLTQPKLIINGTNDPYWTQRALQYVLGSCRRRASGC